MIDVVLHVFDNLLVDLLLHAFFEFLFYFGDLRLKPVHLLFLEYFMLAEEKGVEVLPNLSVKLNREPTIDERLVEECDHRVENDEVRENAFVVELIPIHFVQVLNCKADYNANDESFNVGDK